MCGKAAVSHLDWKDVYAWASSLTPPDTGLADPTDRLNISPSRLRRKSEPDSMIWETLPAIYTDLTHDHPLEATWPFLPHWSRGRAPVSLLCVLLWGGGVMFTVPFDRYALTGCVVVPVSLAARRSASARVYALVSTPRRGSCTCAAPPCRGRRQCSSWGWAHQDADGHGAGGGLS